MTNAEAMHASTAPLEHDPLTLDFDPSFGDGDFFADWEQEVYGVDPLGNAPHRY